MFLFRKTSCLVFICSLVIFISNGALAQDQKNEVKKRADWVVAIGLDAGGDELAELEYENGNETSINAGQLFSLSGGVIFKTAPTHFPSLETQLTVGYKIDTSFASNGDVTWSRYPIELLEFYTVNNWRFGGGFTYHINPKLDGDGIASNINFSFDDAFGYIIEAGYLFRDFFYVDLRYTGIEYSKWNISIDGNSVGVIAGFRF